METYQSPGQRVDRVGPDDEFVGKELFGRCVEGGSLGELEQVGIALDQIVGATVAQAARVPTEALGRDILWKSTGSNREEGSDKCETHVDWLFWELKIEC